MFVAPRACPAASPAYQRRRSCAAHVDPGGPDRTLLAIQDNVINLLADALEGTGADEPAVRARVLVSYIIGVLVRSCAVPSTVDGLEPEIASLISSTPRE